MTKSDLIEMVAKKANLTSKAAREAVLAVFDTITDALKKGDKVVVTGFGTFVVRSRKSRVGRNPQTGEPIVNHNNRKLIYQSKIVDCPIDPQSAKKRQHTQHFPHLFHTVSIKVPSNTNTVHFFHNSTSIITPFPLHPSITPLFSQTCSAVM